MFISEGACFMLVSPSSGQIYIPKISQVTIAHRYSYQVCSQLIIYVNQPLIGSWMAKVCLRGCLNPSENSGIIIESLFCWLGPNFLNCMAFIVKRILWVPDTRIHESNGFGCTAKHPGLPICLVCTLAATSSSVICWRRSLQQWSKPRSMRWFWGDHINYYIFFKDSE